MAKITHSSRARDTGWRLFYRYACTYRGRMWGGKGGGGGAKRKSRGEGGDNIIPRLRVSVKKRITQWHCAVTVQRISTWYIACAISLSLSRVDLHGRCLHVTHSSVCVCVCACVWKGRGVCARTISHEIATRGKVMTYCHRDIFIKRRERY